MNSIVIYHKNCEIVLSKKTKSDEIESKRYDSIYEREKGLNLNSIIEKIYDCKIKINVCIRSKNLNSLFEDFKSYFIYIEAAGGIVRNKNNELLVIRRFGIPDLPKGKIEVGEDPVTAAVREVSEECGISKLKVIKESEPTFHIYKINSKNFLKKTYWFEMNYKGEEELKPQIEEAITEVEWCKKNKIEEYKNKTYKSLRRYFL